MPRSAARITIIASGVVARSKQELAERLREFARGRAAAGVVEGRATAGHRPRLAFVCSGQGPQWWAMGRQLLHEEPVFRAAIERCDGDRATARRLVAGGRADRRRIPLAHG